MATPDFNEPRAEQERLLVALFAATPPTFSLRSDDAPTPALVAARRVADFCADPAMPHLVQQAILHLLLDAQNGAGFRLLRESKQGVRINRAALARFLEYAEQHELDMDEGGIYTPTGE